MSQHHAAPGPYGQTGPYEQPPQGGYGYPPQGGQPPYGQHPGQQWTPQAPVAPQPPKQPAAPVLGWIALLVAIFGIVLAIYRLVPYDGTKSPAIALGILAMIMSIVGLVQATRQTTSKGWVATLALLASFGSIAAGFTATKAMEEENRQKTQILGCATNAQTVDELLACTD